MTSTQIYGVEETSELIEEEPEVDPAQEESSSSSPDAPPSYFAYGPIVNPMVRRRRGLHTLEEKPAILPEHRLTFSYGGVAEIIPQRGYEVHGILMKMESLEEWKKFQATDVGYNEMDRVQVMGPPQVFQLSP